jgi:Family of unknown function (DUF5681)
MSGNSAQQSDPNNETPSRKRPKGDYEVGYGRPPKDTRFKPGQRANPQGRPRGSVNLRTDYERIMKKPIRVLIDGKAKKISMARAMLEAQARKAVKGDDRATARLIDLGMKLKCLAPGADGSGEGAVAQIPPIKVPPSDALVESIDRTLLSRDEQAELARLAEVIDLGGDVTALNDKDLVRFKQIVNKGRGKDITPRPDASTGEAT